MMNLVRRIPVLFFAAVSVLADDGMPDHVESARQAVADHVSAKSLSGRFLVVSSQRLEAYDFARWAEDLALRLERVTSLALAREREPLVNIFFSGADEQEPGLRIMRRGRGYSLYIAGYDSGQVEPVMEAMCRCLLQIAVEQGAEKTLSGLEVPYWFAQGIAQNLYPEMRKRNSEFVTKEWQSGRMPSPWPLMLDDSVIEDADTLRKGRGVLLGWMMGQDKENRLVEMISQAFSGREFLARNDLMALFSDIGIDDIDQQWDRWMLRQKRTIYLPGNTTFEDLAWLKRQLLIHPGDFDTALPDNLKAGSGIDAVIEMKRDPLVKQTAMKRMQEMQLRSAGRSDEFRGIIDAYCDFLKGVVDSISDRRLRSMLEKAEDMLRVFETEMTNAPLAEEDMRGKQETDEKDGQ